MKRFNLRVYGIIERPDGSVLVSDERRYGRAFTKFPGGGLEWGEGLREGLKRELQEELGVEASIGELLYVNDFFQQSSFHEDNQIFSFYFRVEEIPIEEITLGERLDNDEEGEWFRWVNREKFSEDCFTFPIDKIVAKLI